MEWSMRKLHSNITSLSFGNVNLDSCMTLDTEHFHAAVHHKQSSITALEYARSFGSTLNETLNPICIGGKDTPTSKRVNCRPENVLRRSPTFFMFRSLQQKLLAFCEGLVGFSYIFQY